MALWRHSLLPLLPLFVWGSPLSPQCGLPYTTLDDPWRAVSHGGAGPAGGYAGDVQNASSTAAACRPKATGVGGGRWYRFTGAGGDALPLRSPHCLHCGSDRTGWLSGWAPGAGTPPSDFDGAGAYPSTDDGVTNATACFAYCDAGQAGPCRASRTIGVVNCSDFLLWRLPWAPDCACAWCTAHSVPPPPPPPHTWSGPTLKVAHTHPGRFPALTLGAAAERLPPFWMNLNNQGYPNNSAIAVQIVRAREAGLRLLAIQLSDGLVVRQSGDIAPATQQIMHLIKLHHPTAKLIVRWY
eukprot:COSAG04_NODE_5953_length_1448_cov_2.212009_1_plen_296_part_10